MTARAFHFTNNGFDAFAQGHATERVSLSIGPHAHSTTLHMSAAEARAMAAALDAAATHAENVLKTGLGEASVDVGDDVKAAEARARIEDAITGRGQ